MTLAIFDLDNTLLAGDSDYLWGRYLIRNGIVNGDAYERENERFFHEYEAGTLDIFEFLRFQLRPLAEHTPEQLERWRAQFLDTDIDPIILPAGRDLLARHRAQGHRLLIVTATNRFITGPIAARLGVADLIATEPEWREGRYTGNVTGMPSYRDGKVSRLHQWLADTGETIEGSWFYSDSHNDLPLLRMVTHPVAVDPDPPLRETAGAEGWPVISLRNPESEPGDHGTT